MSIADVVAMTYTSPESYAVSKREILDLFTNLIGAVFASMRLLDNANRTLANKGTSQNAKNCSMEAADTMRFLFPRKILPSECC